MPVVARIDGITIEFYPSEHPPPHFHARKAEFIAQVAIRNGKVLQGSLPPADLKKVLTWASQRTEKLMDAWLAVEEKRKPEKIDE